MIKRLLDTLRPLGGVVSLLQHVRLPTAPRQVRARILAGHEREEKVFQTWIIPDEVRCIHLALLGATFTTLGASECLA